MKVKPTSSWVGIDVSMTRERDMLCLGLELLLSVFEPPPDRPLIYTGDAHRFTGSRGRLINVSGSVSALSILQHMFTYQCRFMSTCLKLALGPGPS